MEKTNEEEDSHFMSAILIGRTKSPSPSLMIGPPRINWK
jgi:hypothetical protein